MTTGTQVITPPPEAPPNRIDEYLREVLEKNGSDLHFVAGDPPRIRLYGELQPLRNEPMDREYVRELLAEILTRRAAQRLEEMDGGDFAYSIPGLSRFRVNVFRHIGGLGAVFRAIPSKALTLDQLNMPEAVRSLCRTTNGLILVTGKTGSGKSTTLAAMIDDINLREKGHILTIEDPIEFVHHSKKCLINQREVGPHTMSFSSALRGALREDPDVILVGEMRDLETISLALTAAETGHLVFGTLHTSSAPKTVDRIIDVFPAAQQEQIRIMFSESIQAVITQTLLKKRTGGRAAALEILMGTPAVRNLIREGKVHQIPSAMQTGQKVGMQTLDMALIDLVRRNVVTAEEAQSRTLTPNLFQSNAVKRPGAPNGAQTSRLGGLRG